jgi:hypothetical protein
MYAMLGVADLDVATVGPAVRETDGGDSKGRGLVAARPLAAGSVLLEAASPMLACTDQPQLAPLLCAGCLAPLAPLEPHLAAAAGAPPSLAAAWAAAGAAAGAAAPPLVAAAACSGCELRFCAALGCRRLLEVVHPPCCAGRHQALRAAHPRLWGSTRFRLFLQAAALALAAGATPPESVPGWAAAAAALAGLCCPRLPEDDDVAAGAELRRRLATPLALLEPGLAAMLPVDPGTEAGRPGPQGQGAPAMEAYLAFSRRAAVNAHALTVTSPAADCLAVLVSLPLPPGPPACPL